MPCGAAALSVATSAVSQVDSPDGVHTHLLRYYQDRDPPTDDGHQLLRTVLSTPPAAPTDAHGSLDSNGVESLEEWGAADDFTSGQVSPTALASCVVSTRSAAERVTPAEKPGQQEVVLTQHELAARAAAMFATDTSWPVASRMTPVASKVTKSLVCRAHSITASWSREYVDERSRAYGNFDRAVALGWLIGDALGHPLLDKQEAFTIGPEARRKAAIIKAEVANARRAVQRERAMFANDAAREAAKDAAERAKLAEPIDLPLLSAAGTGQGGRKRRRKASTNAPDDAELPTMKAARAAYEAAQKAADEAAALAEACEKPLERAKQRLASLGPEPELDHRKTPRLAPPCEKCRRNWRSGRDRYHCQACRETERMWHEQLRQQQQQLCRPWKRAQDAVSVAEEALCDATWASGDAAREARFAREELQMATEFELWDENRRLRAENTSLRAEVARLLAVHSN